LTRNLQEVHQDLNSSMNAGFEILSLMQNNLSQDLAAVKDDFAPSFRNLTRNLQEVHQDLNSSMNTGFGIVSLMQNNLSQDFAVVKDLLQKALDNSEMSKLQENLTSANLQLQRKDALIKDLLNGSPCPHQHPTTEERWLLYQCTTQIHQDGTVTRTCDYKQSAWRVFRFVQQFMDTLNVLSIVGMCVCGLYVWFVDCADRPHKTTRVLGCMPIQTRGLDADKKVPKYVDIVDRYRLCMMATDKKVDMLAEGQSFLVNHLLPFVDKVSLQLSFQTTDTPTMQMLAVLIDMLKDHVKEFKYYYLNEMPEYHWCCQVRKQWNQQRINDLQKLVPEYQQRINDLEKLVLEYQQHINDLEKLVPEYQQRINDLEKLVPEYQQRINDLEKLVADYQAYNPGVIGDTKYAPHEIIQLPAVVEDVSYTFEKILKLMIQDVKTRERVQRVQQMRGKASNNQRPTVTPTVTDSVKQETGSPEPPTETGLPEPPTYRAACALPGLPAASPIQTATEDSWRNVRECTSARVVLGLMVCCYCLVIVGLWIVYQNPFATRPTLVDDMCMKADQAWWNFWNKMTTYIGTSLGLIVVVPP
jgi:peptidoglycan hydrolase CwlO-like protein